MTPGWVHSSTCLVPGNVWIWYPPNTSWGFLGLHSGLPTLKPSTLSLHAFPVGHSDLMGFACTLSHTLALLPLSAHVHGFGDTLLVTSPKYCLVLTLASVSLFIWAKELAATSYWKLWFQSRGVNGVSPAFRGLIFIWCCLLAFLQCF